MVWMEVWAGGPLGFHSRFIRVRVYYYGAYVLPLCRGRVYQVRRNESVVCVESVDDAS